MLASDLFVQCDAESWPLRQREEAIHHFGIARRSSLDPVFLEGCRFPGRRGPLNQEGLDGSKFTGHLYGGGGVEAPMHLDQQSRIGPEGVAPRPHRRNRLQFLVTVKFIEARTKGIEL